MLRRQSPEGTPLVAGGLLVVVRHRRAQWGSLFVDVVSP